MLGLPHRCSNTRDPVNPKTPTCQEKRLLWPVLEVVLDWTLLLVSREDEVAQYGRQAEQNCALGTRQRVFPQTPLRPASSEPQNPPLDPSA